MTALSVHMPFPPSVNGLFSQGVIAGRMRRFPSKSYKAWRSVAEFSLLRQKLPKVAGDVHVTVNLYPPDARKRDADNHAKALLDALVRMRVLVDDSQIKDLRLVMHGASSNPRAELHIEPIGQTDLEDIIRERACA